MIKWSCFWKLTAFTSALKEDRLLIVRHLQSSLLEHSCRWQKSPQTHHTAMGSTSGTSWASLERRKPYGDHTLLVLPIAGQDWFPRVSPLCGQSGKIERVKEARGVPLIFLAPYFVQQKRFNGLYLKILFWIIFLKKWTMSHRPVHLLGRIIVWWIHEQSFTGPH